jgi:hypothetical protein
MSAVDSRCIYFSQRERWCYREGRALFLCFLRVFIYAFLLAREDRSQLCRQVINANMATGASGKTYHTEHFVCSKCRIPLKVWRLRYSLRWSLTLCRRHTSITKPLAVLFAKVATPRTTA